MTRTTVTRPLALLALLYLAQGLPYGFQASALGPYLRSEGVSRTAIGLAGLLAMPWLLKALWAPLVDRYWSPRLGRRRSWILPMQALLACTCFAASLVPPDDLLIALLALVLLMNLFAATMDVAVDGLAVDVLRERELGTGNAAQVVGYKVGMLIGGGLLVWASTWIGFGGIFVAMGAIVIAAMVATLATTEPETGAAAARAVSLAEVVRTLRAAITAPAAGWAIVAIATYKLGESLIDPMWSSFLVDQGHAREDLGLWVGTFGMVGSITGSLAGGVLATRVPLERALLIAGALRVIPLAAQLVLALASASSPAVVIAVTIAEHVFGGALTTVMFAFMMSRTDHRISATHFTVLAAIEVLGKAPLSLASGALADLVGYAAIFGVGVTLSVAWLAYVAFAPLERSRPSLPPEPVTITPR